MRGALLQEPIAVHRGGHIEVSAGQFGNVLENVVPVRRSPGRLVPGALRMQPVRVDIEGLAVQGLLPGVQELRLPSPDGQY